VISVVSSKTPRIGGGHLKPISCLSRIILGAMITQLFCQEKQTDTDLVDPAGRERMIRTYARWAWMAQALTKLRLTRYARSPVAIP
jgi:hypothetical protein